MTDVDEEEVVDTLVGSWFHSSGKDGGLQGQVLEALGDKGTYYYVQTYEWLTGNMSTRHVVSVHDMTEWTFYSCAENMRLNYPAIKHKWDAASKRRDSLYDFFSDLEKTKAVEGKEVTAESLFQSWKNWVEL